jgi:hypothetical protein
MIGGVYGFRYKFGFTPEYHIYRAANGIPAMNESRFSENYGPQGAMAQKHC